MRFTSHVLTEMVGRACDIDLPSSRDTLTFIWNELGWDSRVYEGGRVNALNKQSVWASAILSPTCESAFAGISLDRKEHLSKFRTLLDRVQSKRVLKRIVTLQVFWPSIELPVALYNLGASVLLSHFTQSQHFVEFTFHMDTELSQSKKQHFSRLSSMRSNSRWERTR